MNNQLQSQKRERAESFAATRPVVKQSARDGTNSTSNDLSARVAIAKRRTLQSFSRSVDKLVAMGMIDDRQAHTLEQVVSGPVEATPLPLDSDLGREIRQALDLLKTGEMTLRENRLRYFETHQIDWEFGELMVYDNSGARCADGLDCPTLLLLFAHELVKSRSADGRFMDRHAGGRK